MEVILLERIEKLGQMGDVVRVKDGYARNYLLPQKKALRATDANKRQFETRRAQLEAANLSRRQEAEGVAKKLDGLQVVVVRQAGDTGQLYGSVNARDIGQVVTDAGFTITRQQVGLQNPIKEIGLHEVRVLLHPEVAVKVTVNVARSDEEAKVQAKTGKAVITGAPERAEETPAEEAARKAAEEAAKFFEEGAAPVKEAEETDTAAEAGEAAEAAPAPDKPKKKKSK
jgi:large subunit ribosomal protein L9